MSNKKFSDIDLSQDIRKGIDAMGFEEMTPIQKAAIPVIMSGKDIIGQAQTGTGKTAAFGIPALESVDGNNNNVQVLVLCPTRELCIQVAKEIGNLGRHKKGLFVLPVYGGQPINRQIRSLKRGVQIVVGTPGRVIDHIRRKTLRLDNVNMMILDEADEMFDMGFRNDIGFVMDGLPNKRQTIFFSATMPKDIIRFASKYQDNSEVIKVAHRELTMPNIDQFYIDIREHGKMEALTRLIDIHNPRLTIVFCNTKRKVDSVTGDLQSRGYFVDNLHGDLNQNQRDRVMDKFRKGTIDILVATDVAARGLDVDEVDMVFNYDIPRDEEYYVHRIGRTARAGRDGVAISFVTKRDKNQLRNIKRYAKTDIKKQPVPTMRDVEEQQEELIVTEIKENLEKGDFEDYQRNLNDILESGYDLYEVATVLLKMHVEKTVSGNDNSSNTNKVDNSGGKPSGKMTRVYINIGSTKRIGPGNILAAIIEESGISKDLVGSIDIFDKFSFVDIDSSVADKVIQNLDGKEINRTRVLVEESRNPRS